MTTTLRTILLVIFFFASASAFAQYRHPYNNGGGGVDRSIARTPNAPRSKDKKKELDIVEVTVQYLDKRLNLDDFQAAAITIIYNDYKAELIAISTEKAPTAVRKDQIRVITAEIDKKVMELLSEEQIKEYQKMVAERKV